MDYLDADALYNVEVASYSLNQIIFENGHWKRLGSVCLQKHQLVDDSSSIPEKFHYRPERFEFHKQDDNIEEVDEDEENDDMLVLSAKTRYFGAMSAKARQWEAWGEKHYDYYQEFSMTNHNDIVVNCNGCDNFGPGAIQKAIDNSNEEEKLFVRLSLAADNDNEDTTDEETSSCSGSSSHNEDTTDGETSSSNRLVWEGFCDWTLNDLIHPDDDNSDFSVGIDFTSLIPYMDWPGLEHVMNLTRQGCAPGKLDHYLKLLMENIRFTVLVKEDQPLIITGGIFCVSNGEVYLHPRNDDMAIVIEDDDDSSSSASLTTSTRTNQHATSAANVRSRVMPFFAVTYRGDTFLKVIIGNGGILMKHGLEL